jgi:hypothetical protein
MKYGLILLILFAAPCWSQTTTGPADTKGPCSPAVTGSQNTFTISCGIDKQQGRKMVNILNTILANQLDPQAVMSKLDEILRAVNRPLVLTPTLQVVAPDKEGLIKTEITIVPSAAVPAPFNIVLDFDYPVVDIGWTVKNVGAILGGGPFGVGTRAYDTVGTSISPTHPLVVFVHSRVPVKLVGPPTVN